MNKQQTDLIAKIIQGSEKEILSEFLDYFLDKGLGALTKNEMDVCMFYLLEKYQSNKGLKMSNYDWSSLLKISERKIKNLRLEVGIRYTADNDSNEVDLWLRFLDLISEGYLEFDGTDKVIITIENPYLLRFIEHKLKTLKLPTTDYSFNTERIKLRRTSLELLLEEGAIGIKLLKGTTKAEAKLKSASWKAYKGEVRKQVFDLLKRAMPTLMRNVVMPTGI